MSFDTIAMENILDHYKNPHNKGKVAHATIFNKEKNPSCGDELEVTAQLDVHKKIIEIKFDGHGCAISQAAISMLTDDIQGKTTTEVLQIKKKHVLELLGVDVAPMRIKCVMLGLRVLQRAVLQHEGKNVHAISLSDIE